MVEVATTAPTLFTERSVFARPESTKFVVVELVVVRAPMIPVFDLIAVVEARPET